jgi:hypothetical protein
LGQADLASSFLAMMVDPSAVAALPAKKLVHAEYLLSIIRTFFRK